MNHFFQKSNTHQNLSLNLFLLLLPFIASCLLQKIFSFPWNLTHVICHFSCFNQQVVQSIWMAFKFRNNLVNFSWAGSDWSKQACTSWCILISRLIKTVVYLELRASLFYTILFSSWINMKNNILQISQSSFSLANMNRLISVLQKCLILHLSVQVILFIFYFPCNHQNYTL